MTKEDNKEFIKTARRRLHSENGYPTRSRYITAIQLELSRALHRLESLQAENKKSKEVLEKIEKVKPFIVKHMQSMVRSCQAAIDEGIIDSKITKRLFECSQI